MPCLVAIFSVLVQRITCRNPYCKQLWKGNSFLCFGTWSWKGTFLWLFGSSGAASTLVHYISHLISFSPCCVGVLWHGLAQQPAGRPESPTIPLCLCLRAAGAREGPCSEPGQATASAGENTETPSLLFLPLVYIFIKMLVFSLSYRFCCLPVNTDMLVI